jgi:hypothetical protein
MKKSTLLTILLVTLSCFVATAQKQNKKMKKVLFVVTRAHVKNMGRSLKFEKKTNGFFNIFFLFT